MANYLISHTNRRKLPKNPKHKIQRGSEMGGGGDPGKIRRLHYYHPVSSPVCLSHAAVPELYTYNKPVIVSETVSGFCESLSIIIIPKGGNEKS